MIKNQRNPRGEVEGALMMKAVVEGALMMSAVVSKTLLSTTLTTNQKNPFATIEMSMTLKPAVMVLAMSAVRN